MIIQIEAPTVDALLDDHGELSPTVVAMLTGAISEWQGTPTGIYEAPSAQITTHDNLNVRIVIRQTAPKFINQERSHHVN